MVIQELQRRRVFRIEDEGATLRVSLGPRPVSNRYTRQSRAAWGVFATVWFRTGKRSHRTFGLRQGLAESGMAAFGGPAMKADDHS